MPITRQRSGRRGFSLLEVMVAIGILVTSLMILLEIETAAIDMTREAQELVTGTNLAQEKLSEVLLQLEQEGFTDQDSCDSGDFGDFGDDEMDLEFGEGLDEFHFEWCVSEIDLALAGDIIGMATGMAGEMGGTPLSEGASSAAGGAAPDLSSLGISNEMITETLGRYVREVRVRVWWGDDSEKAEARGDEIVITSHAINPSGAIRELGGQP